MRRSPLFSFPNSRHYSQTRSACRWMLMVAAALPMSPGLAQSTGSQSGGSAENSTVSDPYLVFVADASAHLRCGPGGDYYRTDPLRHGQELEVYVEYADGWLGVRPTSDSFCWIPADAVSLIDTNKNKTSGQQADAIDAEVIEDKTKAWIGTNLGRARRSLWQVQLGEGETVTILGRSERDGPDGPQAWYRIVPPSGEFRWIHRDQVVTTAEELIAGLKPSSVEVATSEESIEFLPAGPNSVAGKTSETERLKEIASIRRLEEIEKHIDERQRSRFDRVRQDESGSELVEAGNAPHGDPHNHHLRSFSQRVTDGLATLINGQSPGLSELEPLTGRSSRRSAELIPIENRVAALELGPPTEAPIAASLETPPASSLASAAPAIGATPTQVAAVGSGLASPGEGNPVADAKTVAATAHPEFRSSESQVAIMSSPRLVASSETSAWAPPAFAGQNLQPAKLRTITSAQLEGVQQSVATSTPESLPMIMSSLMARGASAPEIRIVADAAQRFSMNELAQRARDYEALARRRDGDTLVATTTMSNPHAFAAAPTIPTPMTTPSPTFVADSSFVARANVAQISGGPSPIMPTSHTGDPANSSPRVAPSASMPNAAPPAAEQTGVLVEVYSADPSRPPYAITDRGGRTLAYVTPAPGVEIRNHLGSEVRVRGETGYLQGLDTPHLLATQAERLLR